MIGSTTSQEPSMDRAEGRDEARTERIFEEFAEVNNEEDNIEEDEAGQMDDNTEDAGQGDDYQVKSDQEGQQDDDVDQGGGDEASQEDTDRNDDESPDSQETNLVSERRNSTSPDSLILSFMPN